MSSICPQVATEPRPLTRRRKKAAPPKRGGSQLDPAIRHWLDAFHRHHTESTTYLPVALRMDPPAPSDGDANSSESPRVVTRIVYEVALRRDACGEQWVLICWEVDVPGIRFCDCADRVEALALFAEPMNAAARWQDRAHPSRVPPLVAFATLAEASPASVSASRYHVAPRPGPGSRSVGPGGD